MGKGQQTRTAVLEAGLTMASAVGLEGLTIGRLAGEVGLSKSGLFGHFQSKENLQVGVLEHGVDHFLREVIAPALRAPRGEPRVRAMFEAWLEWARGREGAGGGCIFIAAANEFDDRPGPVRERVVRYQKEWIEGLARAAELAVQEGHFRDSLDVEQFAYEFYSIILAFNNSTRLLRDAAADRRAQTAFERLLSDAHAAPTQ